MNTEQIFETQGLTCKVAGVSEEWNLSGSAVSFELGLYIFTWKLSSDAARTLPQLKISFAVPQKDIQVKWRPSYGTSHHYFPFWWDRKVPSSLAMNAPVFSYMNLEGENRLTFALSDAQRTSSTLTGPTESRGVIAELTLFSEPEAPLRSVEFSLRIDRRAIHFADALRSVSEWYAAMPEYTPSEVPDAARAPMYSTWYQYQREITAEKLERELEHITGYGMKTLILDDGWSISISYDKDEYFSRCGTWEPAKNKFPNIAEHVKKFHEKGISYMVWFAVPFVGIHEKAYETFKGKYLYAGEKNSFIQNTFVLDPRFPEVREYTIQVYERAVKEWGIDGLKLDFIDSFQFDGGKDPALEDNYAGRDIKSLPVAVDRLLTDTICRLKKVRSDILIEFRQSYIGPAIRKYGNIFRASDCAMDVLENRVRTIDLRLLSGDTAVHSDMLIWSPNDTPEIAALQILNVIFSTPQISLLLESLPEDHRKMLKHWMKFCVNHMDTLLKGRLVPEHPELSYPVVKAFGNDEVITAVYESGKVVGTYPGKRNLILNAKHTGDILLDMRDVSGKISVFDVFGEKISSRIDGNGFVDVNVPSSGYIQIEN
jgi:alpha-galactosidase